MIHVGKSDFCVRFLLFFTLEAAILISIILSADRSRSICFFSRVIRDVPTLNRAEISDCDRHANLILTIGRQLDKYLYKNLVRETFKKGRLVRRSSYDLKYGYSNLTKNDQKYIL